MTAQEISMGVRPARPGDVDAMLAIARTCLRAGEYPGATGHEVDRSITRIAAVPETAIVATEDDDVAGWIIPRQFDLTVDPHRRRRGHGTRLVAAGRQLAAADGLPNLRLWTAPGIPGPTAFLAQAGFHYDASLWRMRLAAGTGTTALDLPPGLAFRPIQPGHDEAAFVELANGAFAEHPSPVRFTLESMRFAMDQPDFDPGMIALLTRAGEPDMLAGFARIDVYPDGRGGLEGDVRAIGLNPAWRGHGLGRALLRWSVGELRRRGAADVILSVEAANTAALRLYEAEGFAPEIEWPHWVLPL